MPEQQTLSIGPLELEGGTTLHDVTLAYRTWGSLNRRRDNAVVVCHSLTGDADAATWWRPLIGKGQALDPDRHFIVCVNLIGSCYGSTGPTSVNPATGRLWQADFPAITVRDNVRAQRRLLDVLGVNGIEFTIGGSLGGMLALEWAILDPGVGRVVLVATTHAHSAWCIAWSEAQRQAIAADPLWQGGFYAPDRPPAAGLAAARMMAMLSYRNPESFEERFGRQVQSATDHPARDQAGASDTATQEGSTGSNPLFAVQSYLHHQGSKLVDRFDANSYVALTRMANAHDVGEGRGGAEKVLASIEQEVLIVGITTDVLFPLSEQRALARLLPKGTLRVLDSPHGHDAFLLEADRLSGLIRRWHESFGEQTKPAAAPRIPSSISNQPTSTLTLPCIST